MELKARYKQTEVGVIPEDWNCSALGNLCDTSSGTTPSRSLVERYFRGGTINWVKTLDLNNSVIFSTDERVTEAALNETSLRVYPKNTVLVAMYGGFNQIGRTGILSFPACVNQAITAVRCGTQLDAGYLLATLNFKVEYWKSVASSSRKDPNITSKDIRDFVISYPPKAEQQAIAEALSDADALIESLDQLITKKRQIKQGAMQELLTGKRRLPGFSDEWKEKSLSELAEIDPDQIGSSTDPEYEFKYISLEDVDFGSLRGHSLQFFGTAPSRARRKLRFNDLLVSTVRPNLKSHLWFRDSSTDWVCSTGFSVVRCFNSLSHPGYVFAHLFADGISRQIDALLTGSNYPAINSRDVRQLKIPIPSLEEQAAIAAILNDMDTELEALESQLAKARQVKQGMMQELLTGRIRLL